MATARKLLGRGSHGPLLRLLGVGLLVAGVGLLYLAPLEMYCFYLFEDAGRFHYAGFGFGSFMFAVIAGQIICYYAGGTVAVVLGYGHLRLRSWVRPLTEAALWLWLVVGIPVIVAAMFVYAGQKEPSVASAVIFAVALMLAYAVVPYVMLRIYRGQAIRKALAPPDDPPKLVERLPVSVLVIVGLEAFFLAVLTGLTMLNGIFPVFGRFVYGLEGIQLLAGSSLLLLWITWGTLRQRMWAWWAALALFGLLAISSVLTLMRTSFAELLAGLAFPAREIDMLDGIPAEGYHLAFLAGAPLLLTCLVIIIARRSWRSNATS